MMKIFFLSLLFVITLFADGAREKKLDQVSLQLHWKYQFEFAGFIAAKEKGFYKDVGLDVKLKEYRNGVDIEKDVLNGTATYGIYNSSTLLDYLQGKPLKLVASFFKRSALVLLVKPEIKSPQGLVGKTIMSSTKEDFILNFKPYLDAYGVSVDDLKLTQHTYNTDDFLDHNIAAMTAFVSYQPFQLDNKGIKYNILDPSDDNLFVLQMELFTSAQEVENHPSRVVSFRNASIRGWQYALEHKEEIAELIHKKYAPQMSVKELLQEAKGIEKLILPHTYEIGSVDKNFLNKQMEFFKDYYNLDRSKELSDFIFNYEYIDKNLCLSNEEKKYVQKQQSINVCVYHDQFPVDGIQNGEMTGIMSDIFNDISHTSSLNFQAIKTNSMQEIKQKIESGECQVLSIYATKSTKFPNLVPTSPFMGIHFTLISTLDKSFILKTEELKGKTLIVQRECFKKYLLSLYPYLNIVVENDKNKMVDMLLSSEVYAIASVDYQADYMIDKYGYGKLKISGFLAKEKPAPVSIGVQKSDLLLYSIIEKSLKKISQSRLDNILNGWRISRYQKTLDRSLIFKMALAMVFIMAVMYVYQRKLKHFNKELEKQVDLKTTQLRKINESLEESVRQKIEELIEKDAILTAQSKQAVMGEMISMIAHQWRQPLNTITLQISNMQLRYLLKNKPTDEEIVKAFEEINETVVYLSETVDDFRSYFHKDKKCVEVKIEDLIHKTINLIAPRLQTIILELDFDEEVVAQVYVNEFVQVLLNILNNAIDAHANNKTEQKFIKITLKQAEKNIEISIKDNAGGIAPDHIDKLFEPYFSTKGKNGTGLGLYMSQMIIEKHFGGSILVKTQGEESEFTIVLPPITCPV